MRLPAFLAIGLVTLAGVVLCGLGGYAPWASLTLEIGAGALFVAVASLTVAGTSPKRRLANLELGRNRRSNLWELLPGFAALLHAANPRRFAKPPEDVEILPPHGSPETPAPPGDSDGLLFGYPYRRHRLGLLLFAITVWIGLSIAPLPRWLLEAMSPRAFELWGELSAFGGSGDGWRPWSVAPFSSLQDLWLWIAYLSLFFVAYQLVGSRTHLRTLTIGVVALGTLSGGYGLYQWASELAQFVTTDGLSSLRATGTFGNRNHYAMFQSMCFLVALGWLASAWIEARRAGPRDHQNRRGHLLAMSFATSVIFLGIFFSLSRGAMGATMLALGLFIVLARPAFSREHRSGRPLLAIPGWIPLAFGVGALALWLGVEPVIDRYQLLPQDVTGARGRLMVWQDSLGSVPDFWLTGSGLSSFQYVFPLYRTFGGIRFYTWAHNDYLQLLVELGLPGLLLLFWLAVAVFARARRLRAHLAGHDTIFVLHAGYCAAASSALLHSSVDFGLHLPANAMLFALVTAVLLGTIPRRRTSRAATVASAERELRVVQEPIRLSR